MLILKTVIPPLIDFLLNIYHESQRCTNLEEFHVIFFYEEFNIIIQNFILILIFNIIQGVT